MSLFKLVVFIINIILLLVIIIFYFIIPGELFSENDKLQLSEIYNLKPLINIVASNEEYKLNETFTLRF